MDSASLSYSVEMFVIKSMVREITLRTHGGLVFIFT